MKKNIGLIGCGGWGKYILRDLLTLQANVWVVAPSEKTRQFAMQQGASGVFATIKDIAADMDGFVVATPTLNHAEILDELLGYDKPIFVEKPLCNDVNKARSLLQKGREKIFIMDKWRYHCGIDTIANYVKEGVLGKIEFIKINRLGWGNPHDDVDATWILLPHDLSIIYHILNKLPALYSVTPMIPSKPTLGTVITLKDNLSPTVVMEMSTIDAVRSRSLLVVGSKATIALAGAYDDELIFIEGEPAELKRPVKKISFENKMPLYLELKAFIDYLYGAEMPKSSLEEGVLFVEMVHAIRQHLGLSQTEVVAHYCLQD